ncbi:MAG: 50S ribosomal protein L15 [Spirochaetaceae bacterium]|nr:MAG: 50S ribosomal protein L15 [Spirochaetaceae bacterium]
MNDFKLKVPRGATKKIKRIGRGPGSGHGKTACKGNKGQNARSGGSVRPGFEGGQMPLYRRIAHRGFSNAIFKRTYSVLNIDDLEVFGIGETVNAATLVEKNLMKASEKKIKLLGRGELAKKLTVELDKVSGKAKEKIEKAGGTVKELYIPVVKVKKKAKKVR